MEFRKYLRDLIANRQLTLSQIEMKSGIPSTYMSQVISGKRDMPNETTLIKLARFLGVPENEMLEKAGKSQGDIEENFRTYLRNLIDDNQLTLTQVEIRSGISNSYLSQILSGKRGVPPEETLRKLARSLGINEFEMLEKAGKLTYDFIQQVKEYLSKNHQWVQDHGEKETVPQDSLTLGEKIKKSRIEKGLTINELSESLCCPEELLLDIEEGKQIPGEGTLNAIANELSIHSDYFQSEKIPYVTGKDYFEYKFGKIHDYLNKIYEAIDNPGKLSPEFSGKIKRYPIFSLTENSHKDFFDESRIKGYLLLPVNIFFNIDIAVMVETGTEPLTSKGDYLLIKKTNLLDKEGVTCLFFDLREMNYSIKRVYHGLEGKLMAGLNRKEAIYNFYEERHREIKILGNVKYLIRQIEEDPNT